MRRHAVVESRIVVAFGTYKFPITYLNDPRVKPLIFLEPLSRVVRHEFDTNENASHFLTVTIHD